MVEHLTMENFDEKTKKGKVVVDFYASWCGPCKMLGPVFEELAEENKGTQFYKVSTEDSPELAEKFAVSSIPCIIMFNDGEEVERMIGFGGKELIQEKIDEM